MDMNEALIHISYAHNSPDKCERHVLILAAGTGDNPAWSDFPPSYKKMPKNSASLQELL